MAINYLRRVQARYQGQGQSDVERGIASGEAIGKLLGDLGTAIQGAQKNALANKLMTDQAISSQPGAGVTQDLGTLPGGPQPGPPRADLVNSGPDPDPDPTSVTYPSGGGVSVGGAINGRPDMSAQPTYTTEEMPDLSQAVAQQKAVTSLSAQPPPPSGDNWSLSGFGSGGSAGSVGEGQFPGGSSAGAGTVGGLVHTGGVQELDLQKEMLAMQGTRQAQALAAQKGQMDLADRQAEASGTGRYALDAPLKRAQLVAAQSKALNPPTAKTAVVKNAPPVNINEEPVTDQTQLTKYFDGQYGNGTSAAITGQLVSGGGIPKDENGNPLPNISIPVGKKTVPVPVTDVQTFAKQLNVQRIKQGQAPLPVPGEDPAIGKARDFPYPLKTRVDALSRPHGSWVKAPNGQIAQIP